MSPVTALAGGVFGVGAVDDNSDLRDLVDDIGSKSFAARQGHRGRPDEFDEPLWTQLEETGLTRLTSTPDLGAGPVELAIVLRGIARHAGAVPVAETDLLGAWLAEAARLAVPGTGPLTVAIAHAHIANGRLVGTAHDVPWTRAATANGGLVLAARTGDGLYVGLLVDPNITDRQNLAGEPRDSVAFDVDAKQFTRLDAEVGDQLIRRGAWARCVQTVGTLDAAAELAVAHTQERVQFGRSLSKFQSVQHSLSQLAGEIERARAAVTLAVAAAAEHGFDSAQNDYAVAVAKVVVGRATNPVTSIAHQLHGAIGVTIEHQLWLSTMRALSWIDEFGGTGHYARRLGRAATAASRSEGGVWDLLIGNDLRGWG
ncbi:acyl-CoA dehydrogenase family protein [Mycolicibacterium hodleri]|uniref:Acyl-CoA dehydrogenase n=1 Tax=Mycolicibacterium hodleri TaxID=49897 RepID=A0A502EIW0_9MYCO|nr:acyl-CoA dehydrogenase family protein [Mycolicibacterium hodleri]TPG36436.1 acyl-CoA dehydrogenase [Mycolicibacterium hodleri]